MNKEIFTIKLAGINIKICASFFSSKQYCADYLTDEKPDISITVTEKDIATEIDASVKKYSDEYFETLAIYRKIADALIDYDIILMHGSAVIINGKCNILTGPSGAGKSTQAAFLKQYAPDNVEIINDDKPLIKVEDDKCIVYGSPWDGSHRINKNVSCNLNNIYFVKKSNLNEIVHLNQQDILIDIIAQVYKSENTSRVNKTLNLITKLMHSTNFYELKCTKDISAAKLVFKALSK